jgi:hypothetical protein
VFRLALARANHLHVVLACARTVTSSWLPAPAIDACERAFDADTNGQRRLEALVGSRYGPVALIERWVRAFERDEAEIGCLVRSAERT